MKFRRNVSPGPLLLEGAQNCHVRMYPFLSIMSIRGHVVDSATQKNLGASASSKMSPTSAWTMSLRHAPMKCVKGPPFGMPLVEAFDAGNLDRAAASALAVKFVALTTEVIRNCIFFVYGNEEKEGLEAFELYHHRHGLLHPTT
jgi:hypothetical protein